MFAEDNYNSPNAQEILTASPEKLTLMLYDGAIGFINESIAAIGEKNIEKSHVANERVQSIIRELMSTLDMQYDLSKHLMRLYDYLEYRLQSAKLKNDVSELEEARSLITELRNTWAQALPK